MVLLFFTTEKEDIDLPKLLFTIGLFDIPATVLIVLFIDNILNFLKTAECIKEQNQGFIGNEQKGDAYEFSKDTCQELSR